MTKLNERVVGAIGLTDEAMGGSLSKAAIKLIAGDLAEYPEVDVLHALERVRREHHGRLTIAAIFERLRNAPRTMTSDEAWSLVLQKEPWNEERTCVLPQAALTAWWAAADVYRAGDRIGARMAFKGAWPAAVAEHGDAMAISEGWDREDRARAIEQAVAEGLLTVEQARPYGVLPAPDPDAGVPALAGPEADDSVPKPKVESFISRFADVLRGQQADREAASRDVDLAHAMVKHGRATDVEAALVEIREITDAARADLAAELQRAELAEMKSIRAAVAADDPAFGPAPAAE